jgi:hypothetical protein
VYKPCNKNWPQTLTGFTNLVHPLANMIDHTHHKKAMQYETHKNNHESEHLGTESIISSLYVQNDLN